MIQWATCVAATILPVLSLIAAARASASCTYPEDHTLCSLEEEESKEKATEETKEAQQKAAEEPKPVTALSVVITAHYGHTYKEPGYTSIKLVTTPGTPTTEEQGEANGTNGIFLTASAEGGDHLSWRPSETGSAVIEQPWQCSQPNESFSYTLTARGSVGATITTITQFHAHLRAKWCRKAKRREEAANKRLREEVARDEREEAKKQEEKVHQETEQYNREKGAWEDNCKKLGGTVVWLHVGTTGALAPFCRGPNGGIIAVPS